MSQNKIFFDTNVSRADPGNSEKLETTMKILHISLTQQGNDYASLRYFWDNPVNYKEHRLPLSEIKGLSDRAETDYYTHLPVDYATTGKALYNQGNRILFGINCT